ncbi:hypothetical protein HRbin30_00619 [bacterium HR30]|nr:hypothetical protein HRbin30_00619 [bacterium HR30]
MQEGVEPVLVLRLQAAGAIETLHQLDAVRLQRSMAPGSTLIGLA